MEEETKRFVRRKFEEYYRRVRLKVPNDFWVREWGFILFDRYFPEKMVMRRHRSFGTEKEITVYLKENAPAHVYFSTAIYKYPSADMANKEWLGSDLIFDLDADHVISKEDFQMHSYEQMLELVKKETLKLIDFLLDDFGFEEKDIELVFSGSRGYHIHVKKEDVRGIGSRERREIVDYVAIGPDIDRFLKDKMVNYSDEGLRRCSYCNKITRRIICPVCGRDTISLIGKGDLRILTHEGWGERLLMGLIDFLHEIAEMEEEEAIEELKKIGRVDEIRAKKVIRIAKNEVAMKRIEKGMLDQIPSFPNSVWQEIIKNVRVKSANRPDEPVTADIKRLIRMPTSLHAKSSLEAKPLRIEDLKDFNPLEDAVVFGDSEVKINALRHSTIKMKGERYAVEEGEITSLPEHVALYFICRGVAELK